MRHPPRLDSASDKTLMLFPCFDLCLTAWREYETVFHGTVVGAEILDFFVTGFFLDVDDLEVDVFLFGIVTVLSLTGFNSRGWNAGRGLVDCMGCRFRLLADWCWACTGWLWMKLRCWADAGCLHGLLLVRCLRC